MQTRHIPNLISGLRIILVAPLAWLIVDYRYEAALLVFSVAAASDAADGFLARRFDWRSRLGGMLDPVADKLLLIACFVSLGWVGVLPAWLVGLVILRDVIIVSGGLCYHWLIASYDAAPTLLSKLNTFTQLLLVLVVMVNQGLWMVPQSLVSLLVLATAATTVLSGVGYVVIWGRRALAGHPQSNARP